MIDEIIYVDYMASLIDGDKSKCASIVASLLEQKIDLKILYHDLFQRSLYQVGKLWEHNDICITTEHVATSITECLINFAYPVIHSSKKINKKVIVACVPKEFHQIGAKMVADIFELNGWKAYYAGANIHSVELFRLLKSKKTDLLAISLTFYLNVLRLFDLIEKVQKEFPNLPIIVGGQAIADRKPDIIDRYSNVRYLSSLTDLEKYIKKYDEINYAK
jgi:MerR family transcriptional regulator, light-induced transcriptional regulator